MEDNMTQSQKERKKERSNPDTAPASPKPRALSPLTTATSLVRKLPDFSGRQEVQHPLVALFDGKQLRDLYMSSCARFPARRLFHLLPQFFLVNTRPAAMAEEVLPRLGGCPCTPQALGVISVAELFQVNSTGHVPGL
jgi:hypothetical protein